MAIQHQVATGDTVSSIAQRFNVPTSAVSGFRSNDANVIFPDETLEIDDSQVIGQTQAPGVAPAVQPVAQQGTVVDGNALQPTGGIPGATTASPTGTAEQPVFDPNAPRMSVDPNAFDPTAFDPNAPRQSIDPTQVPTPTGDPAIDSIQTGVQQAQQQAADIQSQMDELLSPPDAVGDQISDTPGEAEVDTTPEGQSQEFFGQFNMDSSNVSQGFQNNPFGTISEIAKNVMEMTGGTELRAEITDMATQIESLNNERAAEIGAIEDDPFVSAGSKQRQIARVNSKFDSKEGNLVNKLTLLQSEQQASRQQAQFVTKTAIDLFGDQQEFDQDQLDRIIDSQERASDAQAKVDAAEASKAPLQVENVGGFRVLRNSKTGAIISTEKPSITSGSDTGGFSSSVEGWASILSRGQGSISNVPTSIRNQVVDYLSTNSIDINKQLSDGAISQITQTQSAIDSLDDLRKVISENLQFIGPIKGLQRFNPYSDARKAQADVDRVRQTVGKALEGGVLRKEDEEKYKKILATLGDVPETALYKIDSLVSTLQRDTQTFKEGQASAGRFVEGTTGATEEVSGSTLSSTDARSKYNY